MEVEEQRTTVGHDFNMKRRVISMTVDAIYHYCVHDEYQLQCCVHCSARKIWMTAIIYDASRIIYFISSYIFEFGFYFPLFSFTTYLMPSGERGNNH